jgi:hypothetical protein
MKVWNFLQEKKQMGMFKKLHEREDVPGGTNQDALEEQYQQLFKKIARDFVYKEDLKSIMSFLYEDLFADDDEENESFFNERFNAAVLRAIEYRNNLSKPLKDRKKYKDVIDDE